MEPDVKGSGAFLVCWAPTDFARELLLLPGLSAWQLVRILSKKNSTQQVPGQGQHLSPSLGKSLDGSSSHHNSLLNVVGACSFSWGRQPGRMDFSSPCPVASPCLPCFDPDPLQCNESVTPLGISQLLLCCVAQLLQFHGGGKADAHALRPWKSPWGQKKSSLGYI